MRLADLLHATVIDVDGATAGEVGDVWLTQDGPPNGVFGATLRVDTLVIGTSGLASRAGYDRPEVNGPAPIAWWFHHRTAHRPAVRWEDVAAIEEMTIHVRVPAAALERPAHVQGGALTGRRLSAGLELLDRQVVDPNGMMAGKVDDLEIEVRDGGRPIVTDILAGPGALARRIGGPFGAWIASVHARLNGGDADPARISFGVVANIDDHVTITVSRTEVGSFAFEVWVRDHVISKIPGS
jgi:sporulation protein YlmC with PRC-barrel domain